MPIPDENEAGLENSSRRDLWVPERETTKTPCLLGHWCIKFPEAHNDSVESCYMRLPTWRETLTAWWLWVMKAV